MKDLVKKKVNSHLLKMLDLNHKKKRKKVTSLLEKKDIVTLLKKLKSLQKKQRNLHKMLQNLQKVMKDTKVKDTKVKLMKVKNLLEKKVNLDKKKMKKNLQVKMTLNFLNLLIN